MTESLKKNLIPIAIVVAGLVIAGVLFYVNQEKITGLLTGQEAAEKAINFINQNILSGGTTASLINVAEENGVYKFRLKIGESEFDSYVTKDGKFLFTEAIDLEVKSSTAQEEKISTVGDFSVSKDEICKENEKPIIYFFGSSGCPHCKWEHPVVENVVSKFKENIIFRNNMDSDSDAEVFAKYSTGGIPTLVFGCKYYRVGSGEGMGEEEESKVLTALICKLTGNKPDNVCNSVQDLINQIHE